MPRLYTTPNNAELITTLPIDGRYYKILEITLDKPFLLDSWIEAAGEVQFTNDSEQQVGFFTKIVLQSPSKTNEAGAVLITRSNGGNSTHDSDHHGTKTKVGWVRVPNDKLTYNKVQLWTKAVWTGVMDGLYFCRVDLGYGQLCVKQWWPDELR